MVSSGIMQDSLCRSKVDPCGDSKLSAKANSALCAQCGKWIYGKCARVKSVTPKFSRNYACRKCEVSIGEAVEQERKVM